MCANGAEKEAFLLSCFHPFQLMCSRLMQQLIQHVICPKAILTLAQRAIKQALRES